MSKTDRKKRKLASAIGESFCAIRRRMARSEAWLSLSAPSIKVDVELRLRFRHKDNNNGYLFIGYREARELLCMPFATAHRAFQELEAKGFIVKTRQGEAGKLSPAVFDNGGHAYARTATTWALTEEPFRGQPPTHAYERWKDSGKNRFVFPPAETGCFHQRKHLRILFPPAET